MRVCRVAWRWLRAARQTWASGTQGLRPGILELLSVQRCKPAWLPVEVIFAGFTPSSPNSLEKPWIPVAGAGPGRGRGGEKDVRGHPKLAFPNPTRPGMESFLFPSALRASSRAGTKWSASWRAPLLLTKAARPSRECRALLHFRHRWLPSLPPCAVFPGPSARPRRCLPGQLYPKRISASVPSRT